MRGITAIFCLNVSNSLTVSHRSRRWTVLLSDQQLCILHCIIIAILLLFKVIFLSFLSACFIFLFYILWYFLTLPSFSLLFQFSSCYHIMTFKELFFCSLNNHFYSILVSFPIPFRVLTDFLFLKSSGGWSLFLPGYFSCFLCVCLS